MGNFKKDLKKLSVDDFTEGDLTFWDYMDQYDYIDTAQRGRCGGRGCFGFRDGNCAGGNCAIFCGGRNGGNCVGLNCGGNCVGDCGSCVGNCAIFCGGFCRRRF